MARRLIAATRRRESHAKRASWRAPWIYSYGVMIGEAALQNKGKRTCSRLMSAVGAEAAVPILQVQKKSHGASAPSPALRSFLVEQARHRLFRRGAADRFRDQGGDRQRADVGRLLHRFRRLDRVGDDELSQLRGG